MNIEVDNRIQNLINKISKTKGLKDVSIEMEAGSAIGDNYLGIITKVTVREETSKKNLNLIMKTATMSSEFRRLLPLPELYAREVFFYTDIVPTYNALLQEYNQPILDVMPNLLASDMQMPEVLIMNDMKVEGYIMQDRTEPLDIHHVRLVMKEYGRFHALHYALRAKHPDTCASLVAKMGECFFHKLDVDNPILTANLKVTNDKVFKALQPDDTKAFERLRKYADDTMTKILKSLEPDAAGRFAVFNHGDGWVNNMLFRYPEDSSIPSKLCLLDFQLARVGSPALDLSYFIFTCTNKKLRDQYYDEVMHIYHDAMRDTLLEFELDVNDFLTFEELEEQMRQFSVFGLYMTIEVLHLMLSDKAEIPDFQNMTFSDDVQEAMDVINYESKNEGKYRSRVRDVILDYVEKRFI